MISPYDNRTEDTRNRICGNRKSYVLNKHYKSSEGDFYFYINTKGYFHILRPCKVKFDGIFSHYEIVDYLLTKYGTLKETKSYGCFKTKEEAVENMKG